MEFETVEVTQTVYKAKCKYCGKHFDSLYLGQITYNLKTHEENCKNNPKNIEEK